MEPVKKYRKKTNSGSFEIAAIAASAGGLKALSTVLEDLPADLPLVITIVQHLNRKFPSMLAKILKKRTKLKVKQAVDKEQLHNSVVYIAPPDYHLLIDKNRKVVLTKTKLVHFVRPSADLLFESIATSYGENAIAIVLTGSGSDGSSGVKKLKEMGGLIIAQSEKSSEHFSMPRAAIETGCVDKIIDLDMIGPEIINLTLKEGGDAK